MLVSYESKLHKHPNLNQVTAPTFTRLSNELFHFEVDKMPPYTWLGGTMRTLSFFNQSVRVCQELMTEPVFLEYLHRPDGYYDMTFVSSHIVEDCMLVFAHKARRGGSPWGHFFTSNLLPSVAHAFGNPGLSTYR
jgi:hypothetical protein